MTWASEVLAEPVEYVIEPQIARRIITLIASPRNAGKSLVACWLAAEASRRGQTVWLNSLEDHRGSVLRPRLEVAGANLAKIKLSADPIYLPNGKRALSKMIQHHDPKLDLVIFDSVRQHMRASSQEAAQEAMSFLVQIAEAANIAPVLIGHTVKGSRGSVESSIGGAGVVQNLSKAIYVVGPGPRFDPDSPIEKVSFLRTATGVEEAGVDRRILACERFGIGPMPPSLSFALETSFHEGTGRLEPWLQLEGETAMTAAEVLANIRKEAVPPDPEQGLRVAEVADWIVETLVASGPMRTKVLIDRARADGMYPSVNTFDRARKVARVEAIGTGESLRKALGEAAYKSLSDEEQRSWWTRVPF